MKGWRTLIFNVSISILVLAKEMLAYFAGVDWSQILPAKYAPYAILAIGIANILLRHVTTHPAGWRVWAQK